MAGGPQLVRPGDPGSKIAMPAPNAGQLMQELMQLKALLQRAHVEIQRLNQECANHATKRQHFIGLLICILRAHHPQGARFPMKDFEKIGDLGINSKRIDATDEILVEIMSQEQAALEMQGLVQGDEQFDVPRKPPYKVRLTIPDDGLLRGVKLVEIVSGRAKGTALTFTPGKPKKIREFHCDDNGLLTFSTDSAGQKMRAVFVFQVVEKEEAAAVETPLECKEEWHARENDGVSIIGICCPKCGDRRKLVPEAVAQ